MHRRSRTALTVISFALAGSATAVAGSKSWDHSPGRPSVTPPPWSHGHCKDGKLPPCKVGHDDHEKKSGKKGEKKRELAGVRGRD
jgi:hypothetical protein